MPVPQGGLVIDMLRVEGGGTRDAEDDVESIDEDDENEVMEAFWDSDDVTGVLVDHAVLEEIKDEVMDVFVADADEVKIPDELEDGVGVNDAHKLDDMSGGISLLPSSSSSESGARVHAGAEDVGCSLSPSSSSN